MSEEYFRNCGRLAKERNIVPVDANSGLQEPFSGFWLGGRFRGASLRLQKASNGSAGPSPKISRTDKYLHLRNIAQSEIGAPPLPLNGCDLSGRSRTKNMAEEKYVARGICASEMTQKGCCK
jgi:hypothetical protein